MVLPKAPGAGPSCLSRLLGAPGALGPRAATPTACLCHPAASSPGSVASPRLSLIKTHPRLRASPRVQGDPLVSASLASAKVLFPNKFPLTGLGAHRGTWVHFVGGQHAPHDTPLLTTTRRQEPPCSQASLDAPETGCQGTPPFLSPPRAPGSRVPQHVDAVCRVMTDGRWCGDAGGVDALGAPGTVTRPLHTWVALVAKDDCSAPPMEVNAEGGVRFERKTGSIMLIWPQANPRVCPGWSAEARPRHQLHASAPLGSQWATSVIHECLGLPRGERPPPRTQ